jgi:hypothetical protein
MILDYVLTSCNLNPLYLEFIPFFIQSWNKLYPKTKIKIILISDFIPEEYLKYKDNIINVPCNEYIYEGKFRYDEDFIDIPKCETKFFYLVQNYKLSDSIIDYNQQPSGQPGLWCQWNIVGNRLKWDGAEKFYHYVEWLEYLIEHFFKRWGYTLNGEVLWEGEWREDMGKIIVKDNVVEKSKDHVY